MPGSSPTSSATAIALPEQQRPSAPAQSTLSPSRSSRGGAFTAWRPQASTQLDERPAEQPAGVLHRPVAVKARAALPGEQGLPPWQQQLAGCSPSAQAEQTRL